MSQNENFLLGNSVSDQEPEVTNTKISRLMADRTNPEAAQVRAHNSRIKLRYPEQWQKSTITNSILLDWVVAQKGTDCPYKGLAPDCSGTVKEIDHKIPLSRGGVHELDNLQMACEPCNRSKHDQTDEEFRESCKTAVPHKAIRANLSLQDYGLTKEMLRDGINRPRTRSLFKETAYNTSGEYPVFFTLKHPEDKDGLISVQRIYLELADPTEYRIATGLFDGLKHWRLLCKQEWFQFWLHRWRKELKAKIRADATEKVLALADSGSNGALQAIRMVLQEDTIFKTFMDNEEPKAPVGRPKKEKVEEVIPDQTLTDDLSRIK